MTKLVKNISSITALLGVVLSGSVFAANSFQEVVEEAQAKLRGQEIIESSASIDALVDFNGYLGVVEKARAIIRVNEAIEAPANSDSVVDKNSFQGVAHKIS